jgi:hypothetical protein
MMDRTMNVKMAPTANVSDLTKTAKPCMTAFAGVIVNDGKINVPNGTVVLVMLPNQWAKQSETNEKGEVTQVTRSVHNSNSAVAAAKFGQKFIPKPEGAEFIVVGNMYPVEISMPLAPIDLFRAEVNEACNGFVKTVETKRNRKPNVEDRWILEEKLDAIKSPKLGADDRIKVIADAVDATCGPLFGGIGEVEVEETAAVVE